MNYNKYVEAMKNLNVVRKVPFTIDRKYANLLSNIAYLMFRTSSDLHWEFEVKSGWENATQHPCQFIVEQDTFALTGIAFELGELGDEIKKVAYHKVFNREKILKELGDILFYTKELTGTYHKLKSELIKLIENTAPMFGYTFSDVAEENHRKLFERYPNGYVDGGGIR